jgi:hypothetical protein
VWPLRDLGAQHSCTGREGGGQGGPHRQQKTTMGGEFGLTMVVNDKRL